MPSSAPSISCTATALPPEQRLHPAALNQLRERRNTAGMNDHRPTNHNNPLALRPRPRALAWRICRTAVLSCRSEEISLLMNAKESRSRSFASGTTRNPTHADNHRIALVGDRGAAYRTRCHPSRPASHPCVGSARPPSAPHARHQSSCGWWSNRIPPGRSDPLHHLQQGIARILRRAAQIQQITEDNFHVRRQFGFPPSRRR